MLVAERETDINWLITAAPAKPTTANEGVPQAGPPMPLPREGDAGLRAEDGEALPGGGVCQQVQRPCGREPGGRQGAPKEGRASWRSSGQGSGLADPEKDGA